MSGAPAPVAIETPTSVARANDLDRIARDCLLAQEYEAWDLVVIQGYTSAEAGLAMRCRGGSAVRGLVSRARTKLAVAVGKAGDG